MEIADVFVINKADRPGVGETRRDLEQMLELSTPRAGHEGEGWRPPIVSTVATGGEGIEELWGAVEDTLTYLRTSGELERRRRVRLGAELQRVVAARLAERIGELSAGDAYEQARADVVERRLSPWLAADRLVRTA